MEQTNQKVELERSLLNLYVSISRLITVLEENAEVFDNRDEILDRLPLLDFYNDDLLESIRSIKTKP